MKAKKNGRNGNPTPHRAAVQTPLRRVAQGKAKLADFKPSTKNINLHNEYGLRLLEESMGREGYVAPMTAAADGEMLDGSARLEVAVEKFDGVAPIIVRSKGDRPIIHIREDVPNAHTQKAKRIAMLANHIASVDYNPDAALLAQLAGEDELVKKLAQEDKWLRELLKATNGTADAPDAQIDDIKANALHKKWCTKVGQSWELGRHKLLIDDCSISDNVKRLLGNNRPRYGMYDPPYGINVVDSRAAAIGGAKGFGKIGFNGAVKVNTYVPVEGDDKPFDPTQLLNLTPDCVLWGANYYADKLPPKKGWLVWDKKGREEWRDNFSDCELAWSPFKITTRIYRHVWMGMVQEGEREARYHPTQKPVALYQKIMADLFEDGGIVMDLYAGSGTSILACEGLARPCFAMEISPAYAAVTLERWAILTGREPSLCAR